LIAEQDVNYLTSTFSIISKKCGMNFFIVQRRDRTSSSPAPFLIEGLAPLRPITLLR